MGNNYTEFKAMLRNIAEAYGPAGREENVASVLRSYAVQFADDIYTDPLGNLIAHKKGGGNKKVMLSAHMDQIGFIVTDIDENGFLRFAGVGGHKPCIAIAREVVFQNGVRGATYFETKKESEATAKLTHMFIDLGVSSREEAMKLVQIGDVCTYAPHFSDMGRRVSCGALDDRLCCAIIIEAMRDIKTTHDLYIAFTSQEEVGLRGATAAGYSINPDFSLNLDVTPAGDTPESARMTVSLGKGPTIKYMDASAVYTRPVVEFMRKVADKNGIEVQSEILRYGGTDGAAIQRTRGGVAAGCISIPTRYIHTPVETADMEDCMGAVKFIRAILAEAELPL